MKSKTLNLTSWQAVAASEKRLHRIIVPMKDQPPKVCIKVLPAFDDVEYNLYEKPHPLNVTCTSYIKCPFSVGDVIGLKKYIGWDSSNLKRRKLFLEVRYHFHVNSIEAKKLCQIGIGEIMDSGISQTFPITVENVFDTVHSTFRYKWNDQYRRSPSLKWRPDLWVCSIGGEVKA